MKIFSGELIRLLIPFALMVALQWALAELFSRYQLLEHILSPGKESAVALVIAALFLVLRMLFLLFGLGWFLARIWLWGSRPRDLNH